MAFNKQCWMCSTLAQAVLAGLVGIGCGEVGSSDDPELAGCPATQTPCNGVCVDTDVDRSHCGECGHACDPGFICDGAGSCALSCQEGLIDCDGACTDPQTDRAHCGASGDCQGENAGDDCPEGTFCVAGACADSCPPGQIICDGSCVSPETDRAYCGASGDCGGDSAGIACADGLVCNGAGVCAPSCQAGLIDCAGTCIDPLTDPRYCGASESCLDDLAGTECAWNEACVDGRCEGMLVECFGLANDADENLVGNNWFDRCVDAAGSTVTVTLRNAGGVVVYQGSGEKQGDWTYDQITSTAVPGNQYNINNHDRVIHLNSGHLLMISGRNADNSGCGGYLGDGYGISLYPDPVTGTYYEQLVMLVASYIDSDGYPRGFSGWDASKEISYNYGATMNSCVNDPSGLIGFAGTFTVMVSR